MKLYTIKQGTQVAVIPNIRAEDASVILKPFITTELFEDFKYVLKPCMKSSNLSQSVLDFANDNEWNIKATNNIRTLASNGYWVFSKTNKNGDLSMMVVENRFVQIEC